MSDSITTQSVDFLDALQAGRQPNMSMSAQPEEAPAAEEAPAKEEQPKAPEEQPGASPEAASGNGEKAPEQEAGASAEEEADPLEQLLQDSPASSQWSEEAKKAFESEFGVNDPLEFKKQYGTLKEQALQLEQRAKKLEAIEANLSKLPLELEEAIADYLQGKDQDPVSRIKNMGVSPSQKPGDVPEHALVDHYFKGKFSQEDMDAIKEGFADEDLKTRWDHYKEMAQDKHADRHDKWSQRETQRQQQVEQHKAAVEQSRAAAIAHLKQNKALAAMIDPAMVDDFAQGRLEAKSLFKEDGTYRPDALTRLAKAELFDKLVERLKTGVQAKAELDGRLKERSQMPQGPSPVGGQRNPQRQQATPEQEIVGFLDQAQAGRLPR